MGFRRKGLQCRLDAEQEEESDPKVDLSVRGSYAGAQQALPEPGLLFAYQSFQARSCPEPPLRHSGLPLSLLIFFFYVFSLFLLEGGCHEGLSFCWWLSVSGLTTFFTET